VSRFFHRCVFILCALPALGVAQTYQSLSLPSADGTELKVWLSHPPGVSHDSPRPVVIALHGCAGLYATRGPRNGQLNARHEGMARLLNSNGYSVLFPDSFSARGEQSICSQKIRDRRVNQAHRRNDVNGALNWLSAQHWVDTTKIALLGWSHGGSTVLAATNANDPAASNRLLQPSLAIAFYPGCSVALGSGYRSTAPLLMLLGELDDWTPAAPCLALASRASAKVIVYPDSHHDFDNPIGTVRFRANVPNGVNPGRGVHSGRNPVTGPKAWQEVVDTLAENWGRSPEQ